MPRLHSLNQTDFEDEVVADALKNVERLNHHLLDNKPSLRRCGFDKIQPAGDFCEMALMMACNQIPSFAA